MQSQPKLKNKSTNWSMLLKPRVGDVVNVGGDYFSNVSGINSVTSNTANWFKFYSGSLNPLTINKTSADISGSDPNFVIDLFGAGIPDFPIKIMVYIDVNGTGGFAPVDPVSYDPTTSLLSGMNSPTDFPDQVIKILAI